MTNDTEGTHTFPHTRTSLPPQAVHNWRRYWWRNYGLLLRAETEYIDGRGIRFISNRDRDRSKHAFINVSTGSARLHWSHTVTPRAFSHTYLQRHEHTRTHASLLRWHEVTLTS